MQLFPVDRKSPRCFRRRKNYLKEINWLKIFHGGIRPLLQPRQMGGKILKNPSLSLARSSDRSHGGGLISHLLKKKFNIFRFWPQASSAGGWCQKSPLDGSNQRSEGTLQQSVSCDLQFLIRKTTDVYKHVSMGPQNNFVDFKSLMCCLLIKSWSGS